MHLVTKQVKRLAYALKGLRYAIVYDYSFRLQFYIFGILTTILMLFIAELSDTEKILLLLAYILILITELQNSALEYALDHLHPETHDDIGRSKDLAAGAVLLAGLFFVIVLIFVIKQHFI